MKVKRIRRDGYPVEDHKVQTADGYVLTMHRIPILQKSQIYDKPPIAFLMTGIYASSDAFVFSGKDGSLPYMLSDLGYDVWMGNNRGNVYCRSHAFLTSKDREFWNFSWHEMGVYDLASMIDYVLKHTGQSSMHFVGVSQGATILLVLTSLYPEYNIKLKTAQLLAPVAYVSNMKGPMARIFAPILGTRNVLSMALEGSEMISTNNFFKELLALNCKDENFRICVSRLWPAVGYETKYLNKTLLPEVLANFPVGGSFKQMMHYLQEYNSGRFQQYNYGQLGNQVIYNSTDPPSYPLHKVTVPVFIYYSQNDYIVAVKDVAKLVKQLPNVHAVFKVPWKKWNHFDFICGLRVKEIIFDKVVDVISNYNILFNNIKKRNKI
ncbi:hypothetical protein ACFFRR_005589 [Megaselia abdita]